MNTELKDIFAALSAGRNLRRDQARWVFGRIMSGALPEATIGAILGAILVRGEAVEELVGAAEAMRESMIRVRCDRPCIDTCGTGGDGVSTFNVSTTAAIIAAAAGATVAKHGNRSTTRASGSTEVLAELGIDVEAQPEAVERSLAEVGIGYLNARRFHPAMRHAAPVRAAIPVRTLFNLLGPLTNPAGARRQVLGVPRPDLVDKMADALARLGAEHAWVVHGDGLCDLAVTGPTMVAEVLEGRVSRFQVRPEEVGLVRGRIEGLRVNSPAESAAVVQGVLAGRPGAPRDHALLNAGAALVVASAAVDLREGIAKAARAVDDGSAAELLERWRHVCGVV